MELRRLIHILFDPWVILGAIGFGVTLLILILLFLWSTRAPIALSGAPTAVMTVISLPTPTSLPPSPTPSAAVTATNTPPPPAESGDIAVGAYVQVSGTGGDGLRFRSEPGLSSEVRFVGLEAEVFEVREGPQEADGHTWWYLVAPFDETLAGWAVSGYLRTVQNP
jgi:hypothetical protein